MANNDTIEIFADKGDTIQLPSDSGSNSLEQYNILRSDGVEDIIKQKVVKTIIIPEGTELAEENYVLDFSNYNNPTIFKREILRSLISTDKENANVAIYLCNDNKFIQIGWGEKYYLSRILPLIKLNIFGDDVGVYKNVHHGEELQEVKGLDLSEYKLNF